MNKLLKLALTVVVASGLTATMANADSAKGKKLYQKKLKKDCGMSGGDIAKKHSQDEWAALKGNLKNEIKTICPKAKDKALKSKYMDNYYDFFYEFANDSGNVPSC